MSILAYGHFLKFFDQCKSAEKIKTEMGSSLNLGKKLGQFSGELQFCKIQHTSVKHKT